uniref:Ubiquitin-related modifier 1 n=1 Tax=Parascaris univalens TaxID=6257 RepID=A0A914ZLG3_PARUN
MAFRFNLVHSGLLWFIPVCFGLFRFITVYSGLFWFIPVYFGLFFKRNICNTPN